MVHSSLVYYSLGIRELLRRETLIRSLKTRRSPTSWYLTAAWVGLYASNSLTAALRRTIFSVQCCESMTKDNWDRESSTNMKYQSHQQNDRSTLHWICHVPYSTIPYLFYPRRLFDYIDSTTTQIRPHFLVLRCYHLHTWLYKLTLIYHCPLSVMLYRTLIIKYQYI